MRRLGSRLQLLLTASEEREVIQHVYELMEIEGSRGEDSEEDTEGDVVVVREDDRLGLLREISSNPRLGE